MSEDPKRRCVAFAGHKLVASGDIEDVALAVKAALERDPDLSVLLFDEETSGAVELDLRGSTAEILRRLRARPSASPDGSETKTRGPGRPKLGVVAREVTLLPRHWDWLNAQPGGASVALRKLVEAARRSGEGPDRARRSRDAAYRFMTAVAGNARGYEEATRALFAGDRARFEKQVAGWHQDVRAHLAKLTEGAFEGP